MTTLAEIRAANKAKLDAQSNSTLPVVERVEVEPSPTPVAAMLTAVKEEPIPVGKPLTFAEKMALKKAALGSTPVVGATSASAPVVSQTSPVAATNSVAQIKPASITDGVISTAVAQEKSVLATVTSLLAPVYVAEIDATDFERAEYIEAAEEVKLAYRDIKGRINALSSLDDGTHLDTAMSELKKALLQNPSACLLLYEEDVGTLASSLRRLVHEDMVASIKVPKEKKEAKQKTLALQIPLTKEMLESKFSDL